MLGLAGMSGCSDLPPSSTEPGLIPVSAQTFEVLLPLASFATDVRVDGGFGHPSQVETAFLGYDEASGDRAVGLVEYDGFLRVISYLPQGASVEVADSLWVPIGGDLLLFLDSARVAGIEPFQLVAERVIEPFDYRTATWTMAKDTLGGRVPWTVPGGGALESMGSAEWMPSVTDTVRISFDSIQATRLVRSEAGALAVRIRSDSDGSQIRLRGVDMEVRVRPSQHPEQVVTIRPFADRQTFISSAAAPTSSDTRLYVGGAPAYRSSFRFQLPPTVPAPASACGGVSPCTVPLTAGTVVYAGIELRSSPQPSRLLAPADTMTLEIRPVLAPDLLPKSPLGPPIQIFGRRVPPSAFQGEGGNLVEIPVTRFLRDLLVGEDFRGNPVPFAVAFLAAPEPSGLGVTSFAGPGSPNAPVLRLILTRSPGVNLR
jgi:hypothetical protein